MYNLKVWIRKIVYRTSNPYTHAVVGGVNRYREREFLQYYYEKNNNSPEVFYSMIK